MTRNDELRFAVLIDADNVPYSKIKEIMDEIAKYGIPTIKRIYGDWTKPNLGGWKNVLLENAITPIQQYSYTTGKNSSDSALIIDAMDILYSGKVDGFCIVSSDSDFTRLATRLREASMMVIGIGERKTPNPFIVSCDRFIYIEILNKENLTKNLKPQPKAPQPQQPANSNGSAPQAPKESKGPSGKVNPKVIQLIADSIEDVADDNGWAFLGSVGSIIAKKQPDFDARNYGFSKLSTLIRQIDRFEVESRPTKESKRIKHIYIRDRQQE